MRTITLTVFFQNMLLTFGAIIDKHLGHTVCFINLLHKCIINVKYNINMEILKRNTLSNISLSKKMKITNIKINQGLKEEGLRLG